LKLASTSECFFVKILHPKLVLHKDSVLALLYRQLGKKACVRDVHVHRLRHTFAIGFLGAGGDMFSLKYLLGHSSLAIVERCLASLNADDAVNAHHRFSPLDNMRD